MHLTVRFKYWFFENYWWLLCLAVLGSTATLFLIKEQVATVATVVGVLLSIAYFLQKQKLEEMRLFREIFKECNARYDSMNEQLASIALKEYEQITPEERGKIVDNRNLCGEEYLYFKRGYIDISVWTAWHSGMKAMDIKPSIRSVWETEKTTNTYYDLPL